MVSKQLKINGNPKVGGATFGYEINDTGVAQGSILSPMLFNL